MGEIRTMKVSHGDVNKHRITSDVVEVWACVCVCVCLGCWSFDFWQLKFKKNKKRKIKRWKKTTDDEIDWKERTKVDKDKRWMTPNRIDWEEEEEKEKNRFDCAIRIGTRSLWDHIWRNMWWWWSSVAKNTNVKKSKSTHTSRFREREKRLEKRLKTALTKSVGRWMDESSEEEEDAQRQNRRKESGRRTTMTRMSRAEAEKKQKEEKKKHEIRAELCKWLPTKALRTLHTYAHRLSMDVNGE